MKTLKWYGILFQKREELEREIEKILDKNIIQSEWAELFNLTYAKLNFKHSVLEQISTSHVLKAQVSERLVRKRTKMRGLTLQIYSLNKSIGCYYFLFDGKEIGLSCLGKCKVSNLKEKHYKQLRNIQKEVEELLAKVNFLSFFKDLRDSALNG